MKRILSLFVLLTVAMFAAAATGDNENLMGSWNYPVGSPIKNVEGVSVVLFPNRWKYAIKEGKDPAKDMQIYYSTKFVKGGDQTSVISNFGDEYEIPNSLIIPFYKGAKAKKGDIVLTWWQSGSGMQRAIVMDDKNPEEPVVHYLDLGYEGDGTGMAEKYDNERLKPNSFVVLKDGAWMPGMQIMVADGTDQKVGTIINVADDKVLYMCFSSLHVARKADCKLLPLKPSFSVGKEAKADFVGNYRPGYKVKKFNKKIGRVWVEKDGKVKVMNIFEVVQ